nr:leucine-rich repeats and immunoglobulin-like domains protein 2 isoform X3 [Procambarus clarkii]
MAGAGRRVSGVGEAGRRRGGSNTWPIANQRARVAWLGLCVLASVVEGAVGAAAGSRNNVGVGDSNRNIQCPSLHEISPCTCRVMTKGKESGLDIVCDHADEKHVRNALDVLKKTQYTIYWMKFRNCMLPRLLDYIFLGLDVRHLNIIRSNLSSIERSSLSALGSNLVTLDLSNNRIREVPTAALASLKMLTFLNLNYNQIKRLNESAFFGLNVLERLSLYENKIQHIDDNAFKGIGRKLLRLNLGKNMLEYIPTDTFHPLVNLEVLDLHENRISHIPDGAFQGLHKLDMLKLEHNLITTIQENVFSDLTVLNSLNIEHNHIVNISDRAFAGLEKCNLEWLELGHNRLDHIPSHALRPLHNLRQLDLDSNKIATVQEDAFKGYGDTIKYILLDKNHIRSIPPPAFMDLHSLEWLKLSHNELTHLTEDAVQPILDTLTMIDVSNNPLECSCDLLWLRRWLSNPNNKDNMVSQEDHICVTKARKSHVIQDLPFQDFNCPVPLTTEGRSPNRAPVLTCSQVMVALGVMSTFVRENTW